MRCQPLNGSFPCFRCYRLGLLCQPCDPQKRGRKRKNPLPPRLADDDVAVRAVAAAASAAPALVATLPEAAQATVRAAVMAVAPFSAGAAPSPSAPVSEQVHPAERTTVPLLTALATLFRGWQRSVDVMDTRALAPLLYFGSFALSLAESIRSNPQMQGAALLSFFCNALCNEVHAYVRCLDPDRRSLLARTSAAAAAATTTASSAGVASGGEQNASGAALLRVLESRVFENMPFGVMTRSLTPSYFAPTNLPWCNTRLELLLGYNAGEIFQRLRNGSAFAGWPTLSRLVCVL